jgi:hypothetical protein
MGATIWQGPHQTAQKSTNVKPCPFVTSLSQVVELTGIAFPTLIPPDHSLSNVLPAGFST